MCAVGCGSIIYAYCAKCPCRANCGHVVPGKIAIALTHRDTSPYTLLEIGVVGGRDADVCSASLLLVALTDRVCALRAIDARRRFTGQDRPPFGLTSRPMPDEWSHGSPYGYKAQVDLIIELMNALNAEQAILVGNSMGGAIAALTAQYYPDRMKALILASPAQDSHGVPAYVSRLLSTPQMRRLGPLLLRKKTEEFAMNVYHKCWHDPSNITEEDMDAYRQMFQLEHWDRSLFEFILAARPLEQLLEFETITTPTLLITGDDDNILGTDVNLSLGKTMPHSQVAVIPESGHIPQEERPEEFNKAVIEFISDLC